MSKYYCEHSGEAVDWHDSPGFDMGERTAGQPSLYQPMKVARVYSTGKSASYLEKVGELVDAQVAAGTIETYCSTTADSLVQQADGAITGVVFTCADACSARSKRARSSSAPVATKAGILVAKSALEKYPSIQRFCADAGYRKTFEQDVKEVLKRDVDISARI